ncbi:MAG: hypothetical protein QXT53_04680 [Ignisphaera sp.]
MRIESATLQRDSADSMERYADYMAILRKHHSCDQIYCEGLADRITVRKDQA